MIKIAALQMNSHQDIDHNLSVCATLCAQAERDGVRLAVLPEMFALMGTDQMDKVDKAETFDEGPIQNFIRELAIKHKLWIVAGTIPIQTEDRRRVRAACLVYNDKGVIVTRYDKMHLFDIYLEDSNEKYHESSSTEPGDTLGLVDTPFGTLGLAVCYDLRFPELFRMMFQEGAEIIAVPSAFLQSTGQAHWETLLRARAIENFCYVIGANQYGIHNENRETFGHSMIINPWGKIDAISEKGDHVVSANIDLDYLRQIRQSIPIQQHQRIKIKHV